MNFILNIDSQANMSIYEQIVCQIKTLLSSGRIKPGDALPSIRALAADLQISVITTKKAYEVLEAEGLIRSVAGKGFYACECNQDYLKEKQLAMLEKQMADTISVCKKNGMSIDDVIDMVKALYEFD